MLPEYGKWLTGLLTAKPALKEGAPECWISQPGWGSFCQVDTVKNRKKYIYIYGCCNMWRFCWVGGCMCMCVCVCLCVRPPMDWRSMRPFWKAPDSWSANSNRKSSFFIHKLLDFFPYFSRRLVWACLRKGGATNGLSLVCYPIYESIQ